MGVEAVKIKRDKYLEAGIEVDVHVFTFGKYLSELQTYLQSMLIDINANVSQIGQGKDDLSTTVIKLIEGKYVCQVVYGVSKLRIQSYRS